MGWRLVEEILDHCPDLKYRQFRVLVALALDARDETRQGMPGTELLTLRANCQMRQTRQAIADLKARGIIKTARRSAPGIRAVYEILPLGPKPPVGCGYVRTRTGADPETTGADSGSTGAAQARSHVVTSPSHSTQSSLSLDDMLAAAVPGASEREIEQATTKIQTGHAFGEIRSVRAYLRKIIASGDAPALIDEAREDLRRMDGPVTWQTPHWCGRCDARTRLYQPDEGNPYRCPDCHPMMQPFDNEADL